MINHEIINERNFEEIKHVFDTVNEPILLISELPGGGKSQTVKNYTVNKKDTLFVVKNNKLGIEIRKKGYEVTTFNKLFGQHATEDKVIKKTKIGN